MLGISEGQDGDRRWLEIELLGEINSFGRFSRGVTSYPSLDDPVHFATEEIYAKIFPEPTQEHVAIGRLASVSASQPVTVDLAKFVLRHSAVLGSTGSGKTSAVASLLQSIVAAGLGNANIVVIDPHAEYVAALGAWSEVHSVHVDGGLLVPYWALGLEDLLKVFATPGNVEPVPRMAFAEEVTKERQDFLRSLTDPWLQPEAATVDTPVPFDLREVWFRLDTANRATYPDKPGEPPQVPSVDELGDAKYLRPTRFTPHSMGNQPPHKGAKYGYYGSVPGRIRGHLADARFRFLTDTHPVPGSPDPLPGYIDGWLGRARPISILDFSGIPGDVADVAIGVVLQLLLEVAIHSNDTAGIGRARPVLLVLEEAHRFIGPDASSTLAKSAVERIAREGRKYGLGLMLVSQRPSELSATALAQCGTIVALRLTNPQDQAIVRAALPDSLAGLSELLPSLKTGEAVVSGEAIALPTRIAIRRPSPEPHAADPSLGSWIGDGRSNDVVEAVSRWRSGMRSSGDGK
jgi:hypothetical protein